MWVRRRPTAAALYAALALAVLLTVTLVAGSLRAGQRRAAMVSAVQEDLQKLAELQRTFQWDESKAVLANARGRLASAAGGRPDRSSARPSIAPPRTLSWRSGLSSSAFTASHCSEEFRTRALRIGITRRRSWSAGLIVDVDDLAGAAARVRESAVAEAIVVALDDWAVATQDERRRAWCLGVARLAAPDPTGWRARLLRSRSLGRSFGARFCAPGRADRRVAAVSARGCVRATSRPWGRRRCDRVPQARGPGASRRLRRQRPPGLRSDRPSRTRVRPSATTGRRLPCSPGRCLQQPRLRSEGGGSARRGHLVLRAGHSARSQLRTGSYESRRGAQGQGESSTRPSTASGAQSKRIPPSPRPTTTSPTR